MYTPPITRGWTEDLPARLARHRAGDGARLLAVIKTAGIGWTLARTWPGTRALERRLKRRGGHARLCPICRQPQPTQGGPTP
jgi:predicted GIY-YIG superfamily endonuclease